LKGKTVENRGRKIFFFHCLAHPGEEEDLQCRSKGHRFGLLLLFFFNEQCRKRHRFRQNSSFHLKGKGDKKACQSSHRSLICDLFNRVLNCNFDWKINAIAFLPKIKQQP
jgi:hypothetical protein